MEGKYAFISYSSKNYTAASEIRDALTGSGISCWMAPQSISAGGDYATEIPKAIDRCSVFVLALSEDAQNSQWVPKELDMAIAYGKPIIPFHIDDHDLTPSFHFRLTNVQRIDACGRMSAAYRELIDRIQDLWNPGSRRAGNTDWSAHQNTFDTQPVSQENKRGGKRGLLTAVLAVALIAVLAIAAAFLFLGHRHTWEDATCTTPRICASCDATRGAPLGHNWQAATCTQAGTCLNCGATQGAATGHDWAPATSTDPKTCRLCGATEGGAVLDVVVGDTVTMGYYGNEAIEWIVLDFDPATNQALLISRYCLEAMPFHTGSGYGSWENSTLRKWLNNNFISMAFTQEERALIVPVQLSTTDNADYGTDSGNDTTDRVFLLSYDEAVYYFPSQDSRRAAPTAYCSAQGCFDPVKYAQEHGNECEPEAVGYTWWWLRTAGLDNEHTCNVVAKGTASTYGALKASSAGAVRPAMWVQLG